MSTLLRCLLIVMLVVSTTGNAWAAAWMTTAGTAHSPALNEAIDLTQADSSSDCHDTDNSKPMTMACGSDSQHCDCPHACPALPPTEALPLPTRLAQSPFMLLPSLRRPLILADPVRPPIRLPA